MHFANSRSKDGFGRNVPKTNDFTWKRTGQFPSCVKGNVAGS